MSRTLAVLRSAPHPVRGGHGHGPVWADTPSADGTVTVFDLMGNPTAVPYIDGVVTLTLTESPIYVISSNANVIASNVTVPVGYTGQ
ncbi:hypothetical protein [Trinickia dinghuensis]|uniref:Uncharacterized protein n=1 Tax=Trinickia dinghuensis TaxID=2291023 RepID=A0A3D8K2Q4_9BURK|nr:hypothetical protein [Trinickia dinghuensis]RDU99598.1 hypothetical protein DWV00_08145 [Trinickia dinghuensis]